MCQEYNLRKKLFAKEFYFNYPEPPESGLLESQTEH